MVEVITLPCDRNPHCAANARPMQRQWTQAAAGAGTRRLILVNRYDRPAIGLVECEGDKLFPKCYEGADVRIGRDASKTE